MSPHLIALLIRWQEAFAQGTDMSATDLCPDQPALAEQLRPLLEQLRLIYRADPYGTVTSNPFSIITPTSSRDGLNVFGYEIEGELGRGGMGVVYKARQIKLNRLVALKMILAGRHAGEADLARFRTEAEAIARLQHPNIVQIYEIGEHDGQPFFSLEFCRRRQPRPEAGRHAAARRDEAAQLVETLARAMQARAPGGRHPPRPEAGQHPARRPSGTPKITDFGLAKKLDDGPGQTADRRHHGHAQLHGAGAGRRQEQGDRPAADVYALGAILYELLTGRPPFKAATALDTILQVVERRAGAAAPVAMRRCRATWRRSA